MEKNIGMICFVLVSYFGVAQSALVIQTDFGTKDGAVAAMKGVAFSVSKDIKVFDLTHEIPAYNIWEAAYRLSQAAPYWPSGTVFVSVVDPGVGSDRKSIVLRTKTGHYFVSPDNGSLTLVAQALGVDAVREIDESTNRLKNSEQSYTFHGRDVYAYTGARLASGVISFEQVGKIFGQSIIALDYEKPRIDRGQIVGMIDILDIQYGNVWTNIPRKTVTDLSIQHGDKLAVQISYNGRVVVDKTIVFGRTFADVPMGEPIAYINSLGNLSFGLNQKDFAKTYGVSSGIGWKVLVTKLR